MIQKLTAQVNHNYENSSMPSSKCMDRKKITNNREKTGRKPGAQPGHPHHLRKSMKPDKMVDIPAEEKFKDNAGYVPTGTVISRQVIGIAAAPVVTEYRTMEFHDKKKGRKVHSAFPVGVSDDVNYDESMKAVLFLSNPLVEPDNNLCERKARILKGKINQAISLRSFEHLTYFCECLSVPDHFATDDKDQLYQSVKEIFKRQKPTNPKKEKPESPDTSLPQCSKAG